MVLDSVFQFHHISYDIYMYICAHIYTYVIWYLYAGLNIDLYLEI